MWNFPVFLVMKPQNKEKKKTKRKRKKKKKSLEEVLVFLST